MNEKDLRELQYEKEMQEQAEYMSRWKLRKEIKKKLRALRKKIKADETSLPRLKMISRRLDDVEKPLEPCVRANDEPTAEFSPYEKNPTIIWQPCHMEHFQQSQSINLRFLSHSFGAMKEDILIDMSEKFGYELLQANAIQYRIYDDPTDKNTKVIEMKVDVVVEDK